MKYELNNVVKTGATKIEKGSKISQVYNAAVNVGSKSLSEMNEAVVAKSLDYIKALAGRAMNSDSAAIMEMNSLRTIAVEELITQPIEMLGVFGTFDRLGVNETIEREVYDLVGEKARIQAGAGDVVFPKVVKERYAVPTVTISGGFEVDYRRVQQGDFSHEARGIQQVATAIMNGAKKYVVEVIYEAVKNATGVKYFHEAAGLTKAGIDEVLSKVRPFGKPVIIGDYALVSQLNAFAGYVGSINSTTITGISRTRLDEIHDFGHVSAYNGSAIVEMPNPYDLASLNADGTNFEKMLPAGLGLVLPTGQGVNNVIYTAIRGGLTSLQGVDVKSGMVQTRFDIEVAADVAKGREFEIGLVHDTNLDDLA